MQKHRQNLDTLRYMLSVLMVRQSSWDLSEIEKKKTKEGITALQAAIESLDIQVYA